MRGRTLILRNTGLFEGIEDDEMDTMLKCLGAFTRRYAKDEFLFRRGDRTDCLGGDGLFAIHGIHLGPVCPDSMRNMCFFPVDLRPFGRYTGIDNSIFSDCVWNVRGRG